MLLLLSYNRQTVKIKEGLYRITPTEGNHLTQTNIKEDETRVFCMSAFVINKLDAEDWTEWTDAEKISFEAEQKKSEVEENNGRFAVVNR